MTDPYGRAHRNKRTQLLKQVDGQPCPFCGQPMYQWQNLDLDHSTPVALGGRGPGDQLTHASCNREAGATLGNRLRNPALAAQTW